MKKIIGFLILVFYSIALQAQVSKATFRLLGGFNLPQYTYKNLTGTSARDMYPGFSVALLLSGYDDSRYTNVSKSPKFGYHLGLEYTQKGAINNAGGTGFTKSKNRINYLQGELLGSIGMGKHREKGSFVDIVAGGYLSFALSGTQVITATNGIATSSALKFGNDVTNDDYNKMDLGIKTGLLFTLSSKLSLAAFYEYGISDIAPPDNVKISNRNIQLALGFNFGYKR